MNSTGRQLTNVDFPGNDDSQRHGWDGYVEAGEGTPWIPDGKSGWEFGCNKAPKGKADSDYAHRLDNIDESSRADLTFVFVTPRRWPGKKKWADDKRKQGDFKNIRVFDASDLEQWLEQSIPAQTWLSHELGNDVSGASTLDECWTIWLADCEPALTKGLFAEAASINQQIVDTWLQTTPPRQLVITADSTGEALAYLSVAFDEKDNKKVYSRDKIVVISDEKTAKSITSKHPPNFLPVFTNQDAEKIFAPFATKGHSIAIYPRNVVSADATDIALEPLGSESWREALTDMGCDRDTVDLLSNESGKSLTVLRRRLSKLQSIRIPSWARENTVARKLAPILFAGTWKTRGSVDEEILCLLGDVQSYEAIEQDLTDLAVLDDPPVWSIGEQRGVVSKIDALFAVCQSITTDQIERFLQIAHLVLAEEDPSLELPEDQRWMASIYEKTREISPALRESIAESLVLLSVHGNRLFKDRLGIDCEIEISKIVRALLTPVSLRNWETHSSDLPMYSEAAPDEFLRIVEQDLNSDGPTLLGLLRPAGVGMFGGCPRTGLLWALEGLAWSPDNLSRVLLVLARMSEIEIDDNWVNKPIESIIAIFRCWMPQTAAGVEQRIECLEMLANRYPEVAWKVCFDQFSPGSKIGHYSHKPKWRNDGRGHGEPGQGPERREFGLSALNLALGWPNHNKGSLGDLVRAYKGLPSDAQGSIRNMIEEWIQSNPSDEEKSDLQDTIRVHLLGRRAFRRAGKKKSVDAEIQRIQNLLVPNDVMQEHAWLFRKAYIRDALGELEEGLNYEEREQKIKEMRVSALKEILAARGVIGINELARLGESSQVLGWILPEVFTKTKAQLEILASFFGAGSDESISTFARTNIVRGAIFALTEAGQNRLLDSAQKHFSDHEIVDFLCAAPYFSTTWRRVDDLDENERSQYWRNVVPAWSRHSKEDLEYSTRNLVGAGRPRAAFSVVHLKMEIVQPELLYQLMEEMATSSTEAPGTYQLQSYEISEAFKILTECEKFASDKLARLEFMYIDALEHGDHGIPNLEKEIESHPGLFSEAIAFAYRRDDDGVDPDELLLDDQQKLTRRATAAHNLLNRMARVPGTNNSGVVNAIRLGRWVHQVREACSSLGRLKVAEVEIGELLSRSPIGSDGLWPCEAVRDVLEDISSDEIGNGLYVGAKNSRGAHWRGEGGDQERELAERYDKFAKGLRATHPYVANVVAKIVNSYNREADYEDTRSSIRKRLRG